MESELSRILFTLNWTWSGSPECKRSECVVHLGKNNVQHERCIVLTENGLHLALNVSNWIRSLLDYWYYCGLDVARPTNTHAHAPCTNTAIECNTIVILFALFCYDFRNGFYIECESVFVDSIEINWIISRWIISLIALFSSSSNQYFFRQFQPLQLYRNWISSQCFCVYRFLLFPLFLLASA